MTGIVVGDLRGNDVASLGLLGVELVMGSWTAVPTAQAMGTASRDTDTVNTRTSASTQSLVRASVLRPNSTIDHFGMRATKKVSIAACSAKERAFIEFPLGQGALGSAVSLGRVRRRLGGRTWLPHQSSLWAVRPPAEALALSKLVQDRRIALRCAVRGHSRTESGRVRIRQCTVLLTIRDRINLNGGLGVTHPAVVAPLIAAPTGPPVR